MGRHLITGNGCALGGGKPPAAKIFCTMPVFACPYSSMLAARIPARLLTAAYSSRSAESARSTSRTARWLRSDRQPSTIT
jgi:hypothetical protein